MGAGRVRCCLESMSELKVAAETWPGYTSMACSCNTHFFHSHPSHAVNQNLIGLWIKPRINTDCGAAAAGITVPQHSVLEVQPEQGGTR